jgi:hypothetical protein
MEKSKIDPCVAARSRSRGGTCARNPYRTAL